MKTVLKVSAYLLFCFGFQRALSQNSIEVNVTNFENDKGTCIACIYNNAKAFSGKGSAVECKTVKVINKKARLVFSGLIAGTYAISVIHDANNNKKFDTNFLGIPKEGYGASKNNLPFAAAPKFEENSFFVNEKGDYPCNIRLRYLF